MMKNYLVAALVGAVILFFWQFFSWTISGLHDGAGKYHPQQEQIMQSLSSTLNEDGVYMLPTSPPGASMDDAEKMMEQMNGRPMAMVTYIKSYRADMYRPMVRGFLIDFFIILLLVYALTRNGIPPFGSVVGASLAIGFITWLWGPYTAHNWFQVPWDAITGHLVDSVVAWALCGAWVGWYLNRKRNTKRMAGG